ncbi:MAG TPA: hypothetical protein VMW68_03090 [Methyloceanibacter sp.]|nr:hypothetical protein [Methyloceanibacter sp.]
MRLTLSAFCLALLAVTFGGTPAGAEEVRCQAIRDSAMCVSEPTCWYDAANNKGCLPGPRPDEDACAVHHGESTCNTSSLGCAWNAAGKTCVSKAD